MKLFFDTEFVVKTLEPNKTERAKAVSVQNHGNYYVLNHRIDWNYPGKIDFIKGGSTKDKASYVDYNTNIYIELTLKFRFGDKVETIMDGTMVGSILQLYFQAINNITDYNSYTEFLSITNGYILLLCLAFETKNKDESVLEK